MMPSDTARMLSMASTAAGFSIFDRIAARPLARARASSTSAARCTKDSASQSTPSSQTNSRSLRSLSDRAASGSTTSGTFTPLRLEIVPPVITVQSAKCGPQLSTCSRSLPSLTRSELPGCSASKISLCGSCTRVASPGVSSRSKRNFCPSTISAESPSKAPQRSFGPCRSARMQIGRPVSRSMSRMMLWRMRMSSCPPWLMFRRKTSAPASNKARIVS